jgi:hypothetical protein
MTVVEQKPAFEDLSQVIDHRQEVVDLMDGPDAQDPESQAILKEWIDEANKGAEQLRAEQNPRTSVVEVAGRVVLETEIAQAEANGTLIELKDGKQ